MLLILFVALDVSILIGGRQTTLFSSIEEIPSFVVFCDGAGRKIYDVKNGKQGNSNWNESSGS